MSELYRALQCERYDQYCHGCPAEHLPAGVGCQMNVMRDEQAERDAALGATVRDFLHRFMMTDPTEWRALITGDPANSVLDALYDTFAAALEAERRVEP